MAQLTNESAVAPQARSLHGGSPVGPHAYFLSVDLVKLHNTYKTPSPARIKSITARHNIAQAKIQKPHIE